MITDAVLTGKQIHLRQITLEDCTEEYVRWLNDSAAHAMGTKYNGKSVGSLADMTCFSFIP